MFSGTAAIEERQLATGVLPGRSGRVSPRALSDRLEMVARHNHQRPSVTLGTAVDDVTGHLVNTDRDVCFMGIYVDYAGTKRQHLHKASARRERPDAGQPLVSASVFVETAPPSRWCSVGASSHALISQETGTRPSRVLLLARAMLFNKTGPQPADVSCGKGAQIQRCC